MAETKKGADAGQAEVQKNHEESVAKGYLGDRDPAATPNKAYTLQSGPDSPSSLEEHIAISEGRVGAQKRSPAQEVK